MPVAGAHRLRTTPLAVTDFKSWLFFGLGLRRSSIAFADAFLIFDPYPGYGGLEKRRKMGTTLISVVRMI